MKKLHLDPEALSVESFATQDGARRGGTVQAYATEQWACNTGQYYGCYSGTCPPDESEGCTTACEDDTWGISQTDCSNQCSRNTCVGCTNEN